MTTRTDRILYNTFIFCILMFIAYFMGPLSYVYIGFFLLGLVGYDLAGKFFGSDDIT